MCRQNTFIRRNFCKMTSQVQTPTVVLNSPGFVSGLVLMVHEFHGVQSLKGFFGQITQLHSSELVAESAVGSAVDTRFINDYGGFYIAGESRDRRRRVTKYIGLNFEKRRKHDELPQTCTLHRMRCGSDEESGRNAGGNSDSCRGARHDAEREAHRRGDCVVSRTHA